MYFNAILPFLVKQEKPKFITKPADQTVVEGTDVTFETEVTATPEPEIEWFFSEKKLEVSETIICQKDGNKYTLILKEVAMKQQGSYKVKAKNPAGEMTALAKLKVTRMCICLV